MDQRGVARPQDSPGDAAPAACDTGAVEFRLEDLYRYPDIHFFFPAFSVIMQYILRDKGVEF